jgi:hypothetical protein
MAIYGRANRAGLLMGYICGIEEHLQRKFMIIRSPATIVPELTLINILVSTLFSKEQTQLEHAQRGLPKRLKGWAFNALSPATTI